jgi:hypothetical protein
LSCLANLFSSLIFFSFSSTMFICTPQKEICDLKKFPAGITVKRRERLFQADPFIDFFSGPCTGRGKSLWS